MEFKRITESESNYRHLEKMPVMELLTNINTEDKTVPLAIEKASLYLTFSNPVYA